MPCRRLSVELGKTRKITAMYSQEDDPSVHIGKVIDRGQATELVDRAGATFGRSPEGRSSGYLERGFR